MVDADDISLGGRSRVFGLLTMGPIASPLDTLGFLAWTLEAFDDKMIPRRGVLPFSLDWEFNFTMAILSEKKKKSSCLPW